MLFEECGHYSGECPCLTCNEECAACQIAPDGYAVDTDRLCKRARESIVKVGGKIAMMTVFECRKCGHQLFVQEGKSFPKRLEDIAGMSCPNCGEQAEGLWGLLGRARRFRGKILCNWEETG